MKALANKEVGDYLNEHFVATFQKVGTFKIANGQKQGGNVASYFCTPDGGILEAVAGPVDAAALLREARWVVETRKMALMESSGDVARYKQVFRLAHVEQLPNNAAVASVDWARLPFFPASAAGMTALLQRQPLAQTLDQQGRVHLLLALYPLVKLDQAYKVIYDDIVGEQVSTRPVADGSQPSVPVNVPQSWGCGGGGGVVQPQWDPARFPPGSPLPGGFTPSADDRREQARLAALRRACGKLATTEVCSAAPLNVILDDLRERPAAPGAKDDSPALSQDVLAHLNVTAQDGDGNFGLLRDGGKLRWPLAWQDEPLDGASSEVRRALEDDARQALAAWKEGHPSVRLLNRLRHEVQSLDELLGQKIRDVSPSSYIAAKQYVKDLSAAIRLLGRDDAVRYVRGEFALDRQKITTVRDLVVFMSKNDLKFAPAVEGDQSAYAALHMALTSFEQAQAPPESAVDRGAL